MTRLTRDAVDGLGLTVREADRCKNFFALGLSYWLYERDANPTEEWVRAKFAKKPEIMEANLRALRAGFGGTRCRVDQQELLGGVRFDAEQHDLGLRGADQVIFMCLEFEGSSTRETIADVAVDDLHEFGRQTAGGGASHEVADGRAAQIGPLLVAADDRQFVVREAQDQRGVMGRMEQAGKMIGRDARRT